MPSLPRLESSSLIIVYNASLKGSYPGANLIGFALRVYHIVGLRFYGSFQWHKSLILAK